MCVELCECIVLVVCLCVEWCGVCFVVCGCVN